MALDVRMMCLGVLLEGEASGYEIQKSYKEGPIGHFLDASYGSIYPALNRLTEEGLVTCREESQEGKPDKKVYAIADKGKRQFIEAISGSLAEDKHRSETLFALLFADLMDPNRVKSVIDERLAILRSNYEELTTDIPDHEPNGLRFVREYGKTMFETSIQFLEQNRHLIETDKKTDQAAE